MPLKKGEIEEKLIQKFGFESYNSGRGNHEKFAYFHNGKRVATTGFSRSFRKNEDIDDTLLSRMAVEVGVVTLNFFKGMINCPKSSRDFIDRLIEQGVIDN